MTSLQEFMMQTRVHYELEETGKVPAEFCMMLAFDASIICSWTFNLPRFSLQKIVNNTPKKSM